MKQVYKIDSNGIYVEPVILSEGEVLPSDCIEIAPTEGLHIAKWDGTAWVESAVIDHLAIAKDKKIAELSNLCRETIVKGYSVTLSDGLVYNYESEMHDQRNLALKGIKVLYDSNITSVNWKTSDKGVISHARADFLKVASEADTHIETNLTKYRDLKTKVKAVAVTTTVEDAVAEVEAIVW